MTEQYGLKFYDRAGQEITMDEWVAKLDDLNYKRVAWTEVGEIQISTVWLGMDHHIHFGPEPAPDGPVAIFETMCFGGPFNQEPYRWATEEQAHAEHARMVALIKTHVDVAGPGGVDEPAHEKPDAPMVSPDSG